MNHDETTGRRAHPLIDRSSLRSRPIDGGGVRAVELWTAHAGCAHGPVLVHRPVLDDGRTPRRPTLALAAEPRFERAADAGELPVAFEWDGSTLRAQVELPRGTSFYGAGLVADRLMRNERTVRFWNTDAWRYGTSRPALYQSHPYVLAVLPDGRAVGLLADSVRRGMAAVAPDGVELAFEGEPFDLYVLAGPAALDVQRTLSALVGRIAMPPLWSLGYHQCRWSYLTAREVLEVAGSFRERRLPLDAMWLDIDHMDRHRPFTWNCESFPDPRGMVAELHGQDVRAVAILDPGMPVDPGYAPGRSGSEGGHWVLDASGAPARGRVWPGMCHFPDYTREETRAWWAAHVAGFVEESGLDGLWVDMNEPSVFRTPLRTLPDDAQHRGLGGGSHALFHNLYGQTMAQATREGLELALPARRPFVLTRSNHIAGARFAATWTGDNQARWQDLRWSITMILSLGLSGQPFSGPDTGGFDGDPSPELFARWFELSAWLPFFRGHSEKSACRKEPWSFGPETEAHVRAALERRMQLLPLLYTLFREAHESGAPIVRPVWMAAPGDRSLRAIDDAFLLGSDLLVAPIVRPDERAREVVLPQHAGGGWYAFPDGALRLEERRSWAAAPLGTTPAFARAGSILVTAPVVQSTAELLRAGRRVHVFLDRNGEAAGRLYEDAGDGHGQRSGDFRDWRLRARVAGGRVVLEAPFEGDWTPPAREISVLVHGLHAGRGLEILPSHPLA